MNKVRFGVIGAGDMGRIHMQIIKQSAHAELVAVCDVNTEAARAGADKFGGAAYSDHSELLNDGHVDSVVVATPHPSHSVIAVAALKSGRHVLVEKPMAVTVKQADEMIRLAAKNRLHLGVNYQHRGRSSSRKAHQIISSGQLGSIMHVSLIHSIIRTNHYYDSAAWRGTWKGEAGGVTINQNSHHLDILQWLAGMPSELFAWADTTVHNIEVEDTVTAVLRYPNGAHGEIHLSTGEVPVERLEITCQRGKVIVENSDWEPSGPVAEKGLSKLTVIRSDVIGFLETNKGMYDVPEQESEGEDSSFNDEDCWPMIHEDFVNSLLAGEEPMVPGKEGIKSLELINALLLSGRKGKSVQLPIDRDEYDCLLHELQSGQVQKGEKK